jgi:peptide deformylase
MAVRPIVLYRDRAQLLRAKSRPVGRLDRQARKLIRDLKDTLDAHAEGIGLAAPQVKVLKRIVVVRLTDPDDPAGGAGPPEALIDPHIIEASDERRDYDGCLSFPGLYGETVRPHHMTVAGLDERGKPFERLFEGFDAVVVHHEIDHLDGILFIDRISSVADLYTLVEDETGRPMRRPLEGIPIGQEDLASG